MNLLLSHYVSTANNDRNFCYTCSFLSAFMLVTRLLEKQFLSVLGAGISLYIYNLSHVPCIHEANINLLSYT